MLVWGGVNLRASLAKTTSATGVAGVESETRRVIWLASHVDRRRCLRNGSVMRDLIEEDDDPPSWSGCTSSFCSVIRKVTDKRVTTKREGERKKKREEKSSQRDNTLVSLACRRY